MKKFSLLSLLFLVFNMATAQQEISTTYAKQATNIFYTITLKYNTTQIHARLLV